MVETERYDFLIISLHTQLSLAHKLSENCDFCPSFPYRCNTTVHKQQQQQGMW